jgi:hypothetical protein
MIVTAPPRPKPIAATIGAVFGGLWGVVGTQALPPGWRGPAYAAVAAVTLGLLVRLWRAAPARPGERLFGRSAYRWAVAGELAAIYAASALLPRWGLRAFFIEVVGIIVGLHFIGLWRATGARRFLFICAGMVAVSAAAMALPARIGETAARDAGAGFGNALVLWAAVAAG